jgi:hypothetical protein
VYVGRATPHDNTTEVRTGVIPTGVNGNGKPTSLGIVNMTEILG